MDPFGIKAKRTLEIQKLIAEGLEENTKDIELLKERQVATEARLLRAEQQIDQMRNSAIRGEVASGRKTKDVAEDFDISPSRVSQIAPRRRFNNG